MSKMTVARRLDTLTNEPHDGMICAHCGRGFVAPDNYPRRYCPPPARCRNKARLCKINAYLKKKYRNDAEYRARKQAYEKLLS
jgi:hypothetical protein